MKSILLACEDEKLVTMCKTLDKNASPVMNIKYTFDDIIKV